MSADDGSDDETRRADRKRVSAVLVVDDNPRCDREASQLLIRFARSEIQALSRRRTLGQVKNTLLWCAFAWNYALRENGEEALALLEKDHGRDARERVEELFRRRIGEHATIDKEIGPLRVTRLRSGAVAVHVDAEPLPDLPDID